MAKKAMILKQQAEAKYSTRRYNRCKICGRPHAYLRITAYAGSASGNWPIRARFPASERPAGNRRFLSGRLPERGLPAWPEEIVNVKKPGKSGEDGAFVGLAFSRYPVPSRVQPVTSKEDINMQITDPVADMLTRIRTQTLPSTTPWMCLLPT